MIIQICIGSACCIRGSRQLVEQFQEAIERERLEDRITLTGSFCIGKCNRTGVTVQVNDAVHVGVTPETFNSFWKDVILKELAVEEAS